MQPKQNHRHTAKYPPAQLLKHLQGEDAGRRSLLQLLTDRPERAAAACVWNWAVMRGAVTALLQLRRPCAIHDTQQQQMQGAHNACAQRTAPLTRVCVTGLFVRVLNRAQAGAKSRVRPRPQAATQRSRRHVVEVLRLEEEQGGDAVGGLCEPG